MTLFDNVNALPPLRRVFLIYTTYDFECDYPGIHVNKVYECYSREAAEYLVNERWFDNLPHSSATSTIVEDIVPW